MAISRRKALAISGSTLAGLSLGIVKPEALAGKARRQEDWPDQLVERPRREGFPAPLPLNADGSAPEHPESASGPITDPLMWRTPDRQAPEIEFDYRRMAIPSRYPRHGPTGRHTAVFGSGTAAPGVGYFSPAVRSAEPSRDRQVDRRPFLRLCRHPRPLTRSALLPCRRFGRALRRRIRGDAAAPPGDARMNDE